MSDHVFERIGAWATATSIDDVPGEALEVARRAIVDYVGVTLAAVDTDVARVLDDYRATQGEAGTSTVIGRQASAAPEIAALANGALGHALDFDDCNESMGGHPTVAVFPAALAVAEQVGADGARLLEGYAIGFEVVAKIGRAVNLTHYERGWHPTATLGVFGATAAAAKVLGLDAERTATALAIAASCSAGVKANFGTMTKPIQAGRAAQNGVFAAQMARLGATANPAAFEASQGFGEVYQGLKTVDLDPLNRALDDPWDLVDTAITVKRYPCCASTHGAVDAMLALREGIDPDEVAAVRVWTHPRRLKHTNRPEATTGFEGKFSVQYAVALALSQGAVGIEDFTNEAVQREDIRRVMGRLQAEEMPRDRWGADHFPAEVEVVLRDGTTRHERVERPRGNGPDEALTSEEVATKFHDCARAGGLSQDTSEELLERVWGVDRLEDLGQLTKLLV